MKTPSYHPYTIRSDERPGWETTAANMTDAVAECRFVSGKGQRPRVTFQKSPDHDKITVQVLVSVSGGVALGEFCR